MKISKRSFTAVKLVLVFLGYIVVVGCSSSSGSDAPNGGSSTGSGAALPLLPPPSGGGTSSGGTGSAPPPLTGSNQVVLTWDSPTTKVDQSCLTDLAGYKILFGQSSRTYTYEESIAITGATCTPSGVTTSCGEIQTCTHTVRGLSRGAWYLAVKAYDVSSNVSALSNEAVKTAE